MPFKLTLKLFIILTTICLSSIANGGCNSIICNKPEIPDHLKDWAYSVKDEAIGVMQKEVISNYKKLQTMRSREKDYIEVINPDPILRVFVSSSMSKTLLKKYNRQCSKYNCILVFNGLPRGSFKELYSLISSFSDSKSEAAMQIDDERFDQFNVKSVPTIILSKERDCSFGGSCKVKYDKIIGNIGVKKTLEQFAREGDLKNAAEKILKRSTK